MIASESHVSTTASIGKGQITAIECSQYHDLLVGLLATDPWFTAAVGRRCHRNGSSKGVRAAGECWSAAGASMSEIVEALWPLRRD